MRQRPSLPLSFSTPPLLHTISCTDKLWTASVPFNLLHSQALDSKRAMMVAVGTLLGETSESCNKHLEALNHARYPWRLSIMQDAPRGYGSFTALVKVWIIRHNHQSRNLTPLLASKRSRPRHSRVSECGHDLARNRLVGQPCEGGGYIRWVRNYTWIQIFGLHIRANVHAETRGETGIYL